MRAFVFVLCLATSSGAWLSSQSFQDQFGKSVNISALSASAPLLVFWSDKRDSPKFFEAWGRALGDLVDGTVTVAVADLKGLPFFVPRFAVTKMLARDYPTRSILVDWTGELAERHSLPKNSVAVLVFGPGGELKAKMLGAANPAGVAAIQAALK